MTKDEILTNFIINLEGLIASVKVEMNAENKIEPAPFKKTDINLIAWKENAEKKQWYAFEDAQITLEMKGAWQKLKTQIQQLNGNWNIEDIHFWLFTDGRAIGRNVRKKP